ncbi:MFS transporter [Staphylococcus microti]|uniref:MFS transporter n=1 Tax=Staphylococcus microti TaxID=569857 RepID=A0A0D6XSB9_9STAP|nr:MFS transporter [Staphylococcus microti]KIX91487.1 MFS transporter [Staphylococcus microti]PNZ77540.1 MFS transporter [Staphylococcus microti]SUM56432.1 macrolide-efflux protein [Staphylococcus microti]
MHKNAFRYLWIGQSFANVGDVFYMVSLITLMYQITSSVTYMAMIPFFITTSRFLSGLIAPLIMEHLPLKKLLAYSQLGKTIIMLLLTYTATFYAYSQYIYVIFILAIIVAFLDSWATPARNALVPAFVDKTDLTKANSFLAVLDQTINLSGWAVGGIIVATIGTQYTLVLTFVLFSIATLCMFHIENTKSADNIHKKNTSKFDMFKEGWVTVWQHRTLRTICIVDCLESIANVVWIAAIMYVYVEQVLHVSTQWWGYINANFFVGLMIGGTLSFKYAHMIEHYSRRVIIFGAFSSSIITFVFAHISLPWTTLIFSCLFGAVSQLKAITQQTLIQKSVIQSLLPKVYSVQDVLITATFGISSIIFGAITDIWGVKVTFIIASVFLFISTIYVIVNKHYLDERMSI